MPYSGISFDPFFNLFFLTITVSWSAITVPSSGSIKAITIIIIIIKKVVSFPQAFPISKSASCHGFFPCRILNQNFSIFGSLGNPGISFLWATARKLATERKGTPEDFTR